MSTHCDRVGIEFISFFNDNPIDMVKIVSQLSCRHISLALEPMHTKHIAYAPWSLRGDKKLRNDLLNAMQDYNVAISMGECFMIRPDADFRDTAQADLEIMRELNIPRVNIVSIDADIARNIDQCGVLVEKATALGMETTLEFGPYLGAASNLQNALDILQAVNNSNFRLVLDAMHFFRSGSTVDDLKKLDPNKIGYLQLCDVPKECPYEHYMYEARYERLGPGEGELPLKEFLAAAPRNVVVGLEIPKLKHAQAGVSPMARLENAAARTRTLLDQIG